MSKSKLTCFCDCTLITVLFLCIMKTNSAQENMLQIKQRYNKTGFNFSKKIDHHPSLVANANRSTDLDSSKYEVHDPVKPNDQIESNILNINLFTSKNNQKTRVKNMNEGIAQLNSIENGDVTTNDKEIFSHPTKPSIINSDHTNENSYSSGPKNSPEVSKTYTKSAIKQAFNDSTMDTTLNEIESHVTDMFVEQTTLKDSNTEVIIAGAAQVVTTNTKTATENLPQTTTSVANSSSEPEDEPTTSDRCDTCIEMRHNITDEYVIVKWELKPERPINFRFCLYLSDRGCNHSVSKLCESSDENLKKCSNTSSSECKLSKYETNLDYIIGWYGCNDNNKNYTNCTSYFIKSDNEPGSDNKALVIALAIVLPLIICVAIFVAIFYNKKTNTCLGVKKLKQIPLSRSSSRKRLDKMPSDGSTAINMDEVESKVNTKSKPILINDFGAYYRQKSADSNLKLAEEFEEMKSVCSTKRSTRISQIPTNKSKNRFVNILPYDHSIVELQLKNGELGSDYINANFISGYNSDKEYIACQGPLRSTVNDFFRMIIERNVKIVVMLTQCIEKGRQKCEKYWPSSDDLEESKDSTTPTLDFDDISVELLNERTENDFIIRDLRLVKDDSYHLLTQFHFSQWPDFGCPQNPLSLIHLIEVIRKHLDTISLESSQEQQDKNCPILVHCSAGVGRSGTFIAVDRIWQKLYKIGLSSDRSWNPDTTIDVFGTVCDMRKNRPNMVQTEDQYIYIYECVKYLIEKIESESESMSESKSESMSESKSLNESDNLCKSSDPNEKQHLGENLNQNTSSHSEDAQIKVEDAIDVVDDNCLKEDKESVNNNKNNDDTLSESNSGAFVNHQFCLDEDSENTEL